MRKGVFNQNNEIVAVYDTSVHEVIPENAVELDDGVEYVFYNPIIYTEKTQEIRMAQCRAQLIIDGKDDDVEALLNGITDPIKQKLYRAYFEYEPIVKRDNPMINEMAPVLGIDLDVFFDKASKL